MEKNIKELNLRFPRLNIGELGEEEACRFLKKKGFKILKRNFNCPGGEIDIVARSGNLIVFVEVKARTSIEYARPEEAVGFRKRQNLKKAARYYVHDHPVRQCEYRFDVISVIVTDSLKAELEWIQNAF
jgi:putative endonuclease